MRRKVNKPEVGLRVFLQICLHSSGVHRSLALHGLDLLSVESGLNADVWAGLGFISDHTNYHVHTSYRSSSRTPHNDPKPIPLSHHGYGVCGRSETLRDDLAAAMAAAAVAAAVPFPV